MEVLRFEPENIEALEELFFIAFDLGEKKDSLDYAGRLYQLEPERSDFFKIYALELERNAEYETLVSLYKKKLQHDPEDYFCKSGLAEYYTDRALVLKDKDPVSSKKMMREAKKLGISPSCRLLYLEGYFLKKDGKKEAARKNFRLAKQEARTHLDEFELGVYFYNDELPEFGHSLFNRVVTCGCEESELLSEKIVTFFIDRDDFENTMEICGICMDSFYYSEGDIADLLLYYEKPEWAKFYSTRAVESEDADEEDKFLHLLVLNEIGNKEETLAYLEVLREDSRRRENPEDVFMYKQMAREVKARGRFKEQ
jgi:tetratricopeptide (TPR) repeat protein